MNFVYICMYYVYDFWCMFSRSDLWRKKNWKGGEREQINSKGMWQLWYFVDLILEQFPVIVFGAVQ